MGRQGSLQTKFVIGILPIVIVVAVIFSGLFARQNYQQMRQALTTKQRVLPEVYSVALAALSSNFEPRAIRRVIGSLALDPDVATATVVDDEDTVLGQIQVIELGASDERAVVEQMIVDDTKSGRLNIKGKIKVVFHERELRNSLVDGLVRDASLIAPARRRDRPCRADHEPGHHRAASGALSARDPSRGRRSCARARRVVLA